MKPTVFIHTNESQMLGARIAAHSFKSRSRFPDRFDVKFIQLSNYPQLTSKEGQSYLRKGRLAQWVNRDLQSFSPLRFLPPQLMGYQGRAVLVDPDVFAIGDIYELFELDMQGKAILARTTQSSFDKHNPAPFYATSVMLLECGQLMHWQWEKQIEALFKHEFDYGNWISLRMEDPDSIGLLPEEWNHLDLLNSRTRLLHNTERSTQPWKTGLPVDFDLNYKKTSQISKKEPSFLKRWFSIFLPSATLQHENTAVYQAHPDPRQERFFFTLLQECLDQGVLTEQDLKVEMSKKYLRPDAMQILKTIKPFDARELTAETKQEALPR